jgi:hypothetical protein
VIPLPTAERFSAMIVLRSGLAAYLVGPARRKSLGIG